ncbi:MAG: FAD:protein FMN transferase [Deltaproteobacteria bacterium]|nr:FAD:protein FMN transferase [Deltaproteobacteria bacterium]MDQ3297346.1 FAD:protein FMN transferase [Myxococcota bacterium]
MRAAFGALGALGALALVIATTAVATAAPDPDRKLVYTGQAMGTAITVFLWTDDELAAAKAADAAFAEMKRIDGVMTTWTPDSEVSRINASAGQKPVAVSDETFTVIARAQDVAKRTRGVFDITVGAFKGLWKFDQDMDGSLPTPAEVKKRLAVVGYKHLVLDKAKKTVFLKKPGMAITLGGIAKGYAVDRCVKLLHDAGFTSFMVQAGGDMYVSGKKGETPWVVGIRDPRGATKDAMFATAPVEDHSFSTSGDYERGFVKNGVRYHHILDPRTGQPAKASRSVTIRAKDAFTADAWSKVLFILGPTESQKLIKREKLTDFEVVWIDDKNAVTMTPAIKQAVTVLKQPTPGP